MKILTNALPVVNDWCISPHGIAAAVDPSSPNSGTKCQLARPLTMPNFVALRQEVCEISAVENFCFPKKWTKFRQNPLKPVTHRCPSSCQISSRSVKWCTRKALQFFTHFSVLAPQGTAWARVHQSWPLCTAKPPLSTDKNSKRHVSAYREHICFYIGL